MTQEQEFQARLSGIVAQRSAAARRGGPWRVYLRMPGSRLEVLQGSYPTEAAAKASFASMSMYERAREAHSVRYEA